MLRIRTPSLGAGAAAGGARIFNASTGTRPTGWAIARTSAATYYNASGVLSTAAANAERLDYNPATLARLGLLVEPASTNLVAPSNDLTNAGWTKQAVTASLVSSTAPDGGSASKITAQATSSSDFRFYALSIGATNSVKTLSLYYKAGSGVPYLHVGVFTSAGPTYGKCINTATDALTAGFYDGTNAATAPTSASVEDAGGGWRRFQFTVPATATVNPVVYFSTSATTTSATFAGTEFCYFWGLDVEEASSASSLIVTTTATAARTADDYSFTLASGATQLTYTFDDASTQVVTGLTGGSTYHVPTNLTRARILYIDDNTAGGTGGSAPGSTSTITLSVLGRASVGPQVLCVGDSITHGYGLTAAQSYPSKLGVSTGYPVINHGVDGKYLRDINTDYATLDAPSYDGTKTKNYLVLEGGVNDLRFLASTLADLQSYVQGYAAKARTTGFKVFVSSIMLTGDTTAGQDTIRQNYNSWLRANWPSFADGFVDFATTTGLTDPTNTTYFQSDQTHPNDAGTTAMANAVQAALTSGSAPGSTSTVTTSVLGGTATGGAGGAGTAPGSISTVTTSVLGGAATGSASAPGSTSTITTSVLGGAGSGTGITNANAPGSISTVSLSVLGGAASTGTPQIGGGGGGPIGTRAKRPKAVPRQEREPDYLDRDLRVAFGLEEPEGENELETAPDNELVELKPAGSSKPDAAALALVAQFAQGPTTYQPQFDLEALARHQEELARKQAERHAAEDHDTMMLLLAV